MNLRRLFLQQLPAAAGLLAAVATAPADDIDVYVSTQSATGGVPLVMVTVDFRPNVLKSTVCTGSDAPQCQFLIDAGLLVDDGSITYFEVLVAALKKVLNDIRAEINAPLFKIGLMVSSDDGACAGPQSGSSKCTNGGYVLSAFKWVTDNPATAVDESLELQEFYDKLEALPVEDVVGADAHKYQGTELFFELYRYLVGAGVYNGHNGWENWGTDDSLNVDDDDDTNAGDNLAELSWDEAAEYTSGPNKGDYRSALADAGQCSNVFTMNFAFSLSQQDNDSNSEIAQPKSAGGLGYTPVSDKPFAEIVARLQDADLADGTYAALADQAGNQNVTSYFLVKDGGEGVQNRALEWAQSGGTGTAIVLETDPQTLVDSFRTVFDEILSTSTTFVAPSVPANVFNRAETLGEVFIALFEPDDSQQPFWVGNLKKLVTRKVDVPELDGNGNPVLDANGNPVVNEQTILVDTVNETAPNPVSAVNPLDGRIRKEALTFWTDVAALPPAPADGDDDYLDGTDGREVARGGGGQQIAGFLPGADPAFDNTSGRKVFTEPVSFTNGTAADLVELNADNATTVNVLSNSDQLYQAVMECSGCSYNTESDPAVLDEAEDKTLNLIKFTRGYDVPFDDQDQTSPPGRAWWMADPLHSRPLALNYGGTTNDIRLLIGGNGGVLHMFRNKTSSGTESGAESWAFVPREFLPLQKRLMQNDIGVYAPGVPSQTGPRKPLHPYGIDGSASALVIDSDLDGNVETADGDRVYVFIGLRRGGKRYYALDISDPDDPKVLWIIGKGDPGFEELAQTWSTMRAGLISFVDASNQNVTVPALFFGGGYNGDDGGDGDGDLGKDSRVKNSNNGTEILGTDDFEGNAVFIVDARDGSLIWKAAGPVSAMDTGSGWDATQLAYEVPDLGDSIPVGITLLDSDGDRLVDRLYAPDTGGNLWRADIVPGPRSGWTMTKVLELGRDYSADNANDRRFFARADVARAFDADRVPIDVVVVTSGDRANPLGRKVENWAYAFNDRNTVSGAPPASVLTHDDLQDLSNNCLQDGNNSDCVDLDANGELPKLDNGWKIRLNHCEDLSEAPLCGEKGLASPLIIDGLAFFTTFIPTDPTSATGTCAPKEGTGLFYAVDLFDASAVLDFNVSNNVGVNVVLDRFDRLASPGIPSEAVSLAPNILLRPDLEPEPIPTRSNTPTFWYDSRRK